jgi:hypothetical protein
VIDVWRKSSDEVPGKRCPHGLSLSIGRDSFPLLHLEVETGLPTCSPYELPHLMFLIVILAACPAYPVKRIPNAFEVAKISAQSARNSDKIRIIGRGLNTA